MRTKIISWIFIAAAATLGAPLVAGAQDTPPASQITAPEKPAAKPDVKKTRKTWTNDDLASLRSLADIYTEEKEAQAAEAARLAKQATEAKQAGTAKPSTPAGPPPALSKPKTRDDADNMIAWEDRDIEAQQEYIDRLRKELHEAPADQKERLQKMLQEHIQILEDTRKEREALLEKKKEFEKLPPPGDNATTTPPPPQ